MTDNEVELVALRAGLRMPHIVPGEPCRLLKFVCPMGARQIEIPPTASQESLRAQLAPYAGSKG